MTQETLQLINILLTGGVLLALIGAAVRYGQLTQKVDDHETRITRIEDHTWDKR